MVSARLLDVGKVVDEDGDCLVVASGGPDRPRAFRWCRVVGSFLAGLGREFAESARWDSVDGVGVGGE